MQSPQTLTGPIHALFLSFAVLLVPFTQGQTPAAASAEDETVVQLSPFEVQANADVGYATTNAITATRFNAALENLPVNMNIFTQEILEDFNLPFANDAARYNASSTGSQGFRLRGFEAGRRVVDGFRMSFNYPSIMMQRVEVLKGPSGVIFGRASPGGMYNFVRKHPIEGVEAVTLGVGTGWINGNSRIRYTGDINTEIGPFAVRLIAGWADRESPADSSHGALETGGSQWTLVSPVVSVRPWQNTKITVGYTKNDEIVHAQDGRHSARGQSFGGIPMSIRYGVDDFLDLGWGRKFKTLIDDFYVLVDQRINDRLSFRVGYQMHDRYSADDPGVNNSLLELDEVDAAGNPVLGADGQVVKRPVLRQGFRKQFGSNGDIEDVQAYGMYTFDLAGGTNELLFGYQRNLEENPPVNNWIARYKNGAVGPAIIQGPGYNVRVPAPTTEYFRYVFFLEQGVPSSLPKDFVQDIGINTFYSEDDFENWTVNWVGHYLDDRLHPMAGVSYNEYLGIRTGSADLEVTDTLYQVGALYKITNAISGYAMFAESMDISHRRDGYNRPFGPIVAAGWEAGFKFNAWESRLSGTVNYFRTENNDIVVFDNLAPNQIYDMSGNPSDLGAWVQVGQIVSDGFEADLLLSLGEKRNYQLKLSYANLGAETTEDPNPANIGMVPQGHVEHSVAFWQKYTFTEGALKGVFVGGGGFWKSGELVGGGRRRSSTKSADLLVGYSFEAFGLATRVAFNVRDVFGNGVSEFGLDPSTGVPFELENPRTYLLDVSVSF